MRRACFLLLALAALFATPALAAEGFPTSLAGFTLGDSVEHYEDYCREGEAIPVSDAPFLSESLIKAENLPGVRGGSLAFGNCVGGDRLVRIKLKFNDHGQGLFNRLYDRYEADFGKPDKYLGDTFKNVIAWEWRFTDGKGGRISLVLMWSRDKEIRPGVSIKMTDESLMDEEYKCYKAKHDGTKGKMGMTRIGSLDAYVPH
ncbi:hypothetical protein BerOc1_02279 [Pseudodesulfovibrio hydrargyri]|uniref:Uncharacterized protein n=1 Tax=Pseudodesulfovibrio hydrargyri TaxID=2125990 RepID=A0A1J5MX07_9BACT|nr:hypothetical protein [Pseudodesulfovibrio hydrargyri]OIQ50348.1 hypothetical protein BerOc1_02279 [Pseudodesulfovibrio hydrargyri]